MFSLFKKVKKQEEIVKESGVQNFNDSHAKEILTDIKNEFGLDYSKQEYITLRKIERFCVKKSLNNFDELAKLLKISDEIKQELVNMLTVGETYFYRETNHFEVLATLFKVKNINRILCAPSSSGEEAYSISIFLKSKNINSYNDIVGIDVNSNSIETAKKAIYSKRSTSFVPQEIKEKYFIQNGDKFSLVDAIKRDVEFRTQNIFDDSLFSLGKFDVIFCRNMLIYFSDTEKKEVIYRLHKLLNDDGVLFLGHADISFKIDNFTKVQTQKGHYLLKN